MPISATSTVIKILNGFKCFGTSYIPDLSEFKRGEPVTLTLPGSSTQISLPCISLIPALVAVYSRYPDSVIKQMLESQNVGINKVLLLNLPDGIFDFSESRECNGYYIARGLLIGSEANVPPPIYNPGRELACPMQAAMLWSANPENWTPKRLDRLIDKVSQGFAAESDFFNFDLDRSDFQSIRESDFPNANKFDFAYRMGFFSNELAKKRMSIHGQYECLIEKAFTDGGLWIEALDFYLDNLPKAEKTAFIKGIETSIPALTSFIYDGFTSSIYQQLVDQLKEWGVSTTLNSLTMRLNYLPSTPVTKESSLVSDTTAFDDIFANPEATLSRLANEIEHLQPEDFCLAHFHAFSQIVRQGHFQNTDCIDPHALTLKALAALDQFCLPEGIEIAASKTKIDQVAKDGTQALVSMLVKSHDFDHSIFKGQSSRNISLLVSAGLDPCQLPRMKNTDMARAFTSALGL